MAKANHFTELECWQEARRMVGLIYRIIGSSALQNEFALNEQIKRASISVMNNIAEGFGRFSDNEFIRFLDIAKASCFEVESMTYILEDKNAISAEDLIKLRAQVDITRAKQVAC